MNKRTVSKLAVARDLHPDTSILCCTGNPIATGKGDMDLVCGACGILLVHGLTPTEVALQYKVMRIVVQCQCGAYNALATDAELVVTRDKLIAETAYYRAEKRGFALGYALDDWLAAEAQVDFELSRSR